MSNGPLFQAKGLYYDGAKPLATPAAMASNGRQALFVYNGARHIHHCEQLKVSPRSGRAARFITLADNGQFQTDDHEFLDGLPQEVRSEGPVAWLEARLSVAIIGILLVAATLALGYFYGLPAAADQVVEKVPMETEQVLSKKAMAWFDQNGWFTPTKQQAAKLGALTGKFNLLHQGLDKSPFISLEFRSSKIIGPNAFALPGGTIVITDQLIELASSDEEILAVLAHEIGHVELRHSLRQLLQSSAVGLIAATITGDAATLSAAVAGLPAILAQTRYSRKFESEADDFALKLLNQQGISPAAFADLMEKLEKAEPGRVLSYLSSHPITTDRIAKARIAAAEQL